MLLCRLVRLGLMARLRLVLDEGVVVCDVFVLDFASRRIRMLRQTLLQMVFLLLVANRGPT